MIRFAAWTLVASAALAQSPVSFDREIRPLLEARCLKCHGAAMQMGKLDLRKRPAAPVLIPGKPADSSLFRRVAGTRVTLDSLVYAFRDGATPEEIVQRYPALELADAYEAVTHYLRHRSEMDDYLAHRETIAKEVRAENERRFPTAGVRDDARTERCHAARRTR